MVTTSSLGVLSVIVGSASTQARTMKLTCSSREDGEVFTGYRLPDSIDSDVWYCDSIITLYRFVVVSRVCVEYFLCYQLHVHVIQALYKSHVAASSAFITGNKVSIEATESIVITKLQVM